MEYWKYSYDHNEKLKIRRFLQEIEENASRDLFIISKNKLQSPFTKLSLF